MKKSGNLSKGAEYHVTAQINRGELALEKWGTEEDKKDVSSNSKNKICIIL